ncbi:hypothetical protein [Methyloligella sp. GL2]|uniref:hypothetical protein n=1 Tax=Methyloligella sp. GL2 TaxID=2742204 RepID=UPI001FEEC298|nr:hypothetical protein [Methyloligella sp. GL2]
MFGLFGGRKSKRMPREGEGAEPGLFAGGRNMALKLPPHQYEETLRFYRDTLGLPVTVMADGVPVVEFGPMRLWLDRSESVSRSELWLEVVAENAADAEEALAAADVVRCDTIEPLPSGFRGFWVMSPANVVHLVAEPGQDSSEED